MKFTAIKEHHLYQKAYQKGARYVGSTVAVYVLRDFAAKRLMLANPARRYVNRVGLSVTKKIGGATVRNRAKRIIREAFRAVDGAHPLKRGYLVVICARNGIVGRKTYDVEADLTRAFSRLDFFAAPTENDSAPGKSRENDVKSEAEKV